MMIVWWMCNVTLKSSDGSPGVGKHQNLHTKG